MIHLLTKISSRPGKYHGWQIVDPFTSLRLCHYLHLSVGTFFECRTRRSACTSRLTKALVGGSFGCDYGGYASLSRRDNKDNVHGNTF